MECPKCGAEINKNAMVCPNCKKVLKIVCPVCKTINTKNTCKKCGEKFCYHIRDAYDLYAEYGVFDKFKV